MKKKTSIITIILYLLLFTFISSLFFIYYLEKKLGPELIKCAENQIKQITTIVMNNSIRKYNNNNNNFLDITKNNKGEITYISYNTKKINNASINITKILEEDLQNMINGNYKEINLSLKTITDDYYEKINNGIIFTVSTGTATGSSLLANIGPKIPLKLKLVGEVQTKIKSKITEYGLNNAMVEIYAKTIATIVIQMPFLSKEITITNNIPLTMEIIQGSIPEYMIGNKTNS